MALRSLERASRRPAAVSVNSLPPHQQFAPAASAGSALSQRQVAFSASLVLHIATLKLPLTVEPSSNVRFTVPSARVAVSEEISIVEVEPTVDAGTRLDFST